MKKVLFTATVSKSHIKVFHIPYLKWFKDNGYEVHVAAKGDDEDVPYCDKFFNIPFERSPFKIDNIHSFIELKKLMGEHKYDLIHCHTPMGGVLTRLAARESRLKGTKILYTAHGFHFFQGAPKKNWIVYYPIEKWLSKHTDCLITINEEDYRLAEEKKFKARRIEHVKGVGVNLDKFNPQNAEKKQQLRNEYGYKQDDFILVYVAELSYRKHQDLVINAVNDLKEIIPNIKLLLAGTGQLVDQYKKQVSAMGLDGYIEFLGYRKDVDTLMMISDLAVSSARQEGLPVNIMEAMATGLPLVVTNCRGNRDLVIDGENGYIVGIDDVNGFVKSINAIANSEKKREKFGKKSLELIEAYSLKNVMAHMEKIYTSYSD
jgi:glycosyltransferase EpsD